MLCSNYSNDVLIHPHSHFDVSTVAISSVALDYWGSKKSMFQTNEKRFQEVEKSTLNKTHSSLQPTLLAGQEELYAGHYFNHPRYSTLTRQIILYESTQRPGNRSNLLSHPNPLFAGFLILGNPIVFF